MENKLSTVELLGKTWFIDERLKQYRSVANCGEMILFFSFQEMDDVISVNDALADHDTFPFDKETDTKLRKLLGEAMEGDMEAVREIVKICNEGAMEGDTEAVRGIGKICNEDCGE